METFRAALNLALGLVVSAATLKIAKTLWNESQPQPQAQHQPPSDEEHA